MSARRSLAGSAVACSGDMYDGVGLDVAMDHAVLVRVRESVHDLDERPDRVGDGQLALAIEPMTKRLSLDVRHHEIQEPVRLAGIEQRQDARMLQLRRDLDLALKARGTHGGREVVAQHLDRNLATMLHVLGEIHRRHAAGAALALDDVLAGQTCVDLRDAIDHGECRVGMREDMDAAADAIPDGPSARLADTSLMRLTGSCLREASASCTKLYAIAANGT